VNAALAALAAVAVTGCTPSLGEFRETLARQDSATAALGEWCARRGIAAPPTIRAIAVKDGDPAADPSLRAELGVGAGEPLGFRHVLLACGDTVLSDARNWYVPGRLTPDMNEALATTQTPFGKVVAPLGFRRERLAEKRGALPGCPAGTVLSHHAVLKLADGRAISVVTECYTAANLAPGHR